MRQHFLYTILSVIFAIYSAQELQENCVDVSGQRHKEGDSYIGVDGCNSCKCMSGESACTKRLCPKNDAEIPIGRDTAYKCVDDKGNPHRINETYTHVDGCNTCTCHDAGGFCTKMYCIKEPKVLECFDVKRNIMTEENGTYSVDGCNYCICGVLGPICTEMLCTDTNVSTDQKNEAVVTNISKSPRGNLGTKSCMDAKNNERKAGEKWLTEDSCNICECKGDGNRPECTNRSCPDRFARLVGNGASTNIMSIASVFAVTLIIVNL